MARTGVITAADTVLEPDFRLAAALAVLGPTLVLAPWIIQGVGGFFGLLGQLLPLLDGNLDLLSRVVSSQPLKGGLMAHLSSPGFPALLGRLRGLLHGDASNERPEAAITWADSVRRGKT